MGPRLNSVQRAVALLILLFSVVGCGNKGKLYLPPAEYVAQKKAEPSVAHTDKRGEQTPQMTLTAD